MPPPLPPPAPKQPASDARRAKDALALQLESDAAFGVTDVPRVKRAVRAPAPPSAPPAPAAVFVPRVAPLARRLGSEAKRAALAQLDAQVGACTLCRLHATRTLAVPGEGNVDADLLFVGEGPGADEDRTGRPFVGRAGELLTRILVAMGFDRESVFIANIVKCRPPGNRVPAPDEVAACRPYLERQIETIAPKVICTLGLPATKTLLGIEGGIGAVRGKRFVHRGVTVVPTFHPAYLLRNPAEKEKVWKDVQVVARLVQELGGRIPHPAALDRFDPAD